MDHNPDKSAEIDQVIKHVLNKRNAGKPIDDSTLEKVYQHLMPELATRLRTLRDIEQAAHCAQSSESQDTLDHMMREKTEFLREYLVDYELLAPLHHGAQGVVYKAVQRSTGRLVAIKVIVHGPLASDQQIRRFEQEVELVGRLNHPNIVRLYDSGLVRGCPYFAMELIEGLSIDDYVFLHRLGVRQRVELFVTVCRAVSYAHQNGIIHRDLKPSNILVDRDGQPHILDFGLAKDIFSHGPGSSGTFISIPGQVVGTLPYLSPEQAACKDRDVSVLSDIYTLGVILFQLLAEDFPYPSIGNVEAVRSNILTCEPTRLRKAMGGSGVDPSLSIAEVNDDLEALMRKALEKDPAHRYQSAATFADDLDRFLNGDPVEARAGQRFYLLRKTLRRYRVPALVSAAFLFLLMVSLVGMFALWRGQVQIAQTAQAGLVMGHYLKIGSVERDMGRIDQATAMIQKAMEIGESIDTHDPIVARYLYGAYHRLAELQLEVGNSDNAEPYCNNAIALAERIAIERPNDAEWLRLLGFSYRLRGRMSIAKKNWSQALADYMSAVRIRQQLLDRDPQNPDLLSELASAFGSIGRCYRKLNQDDDSLHYYRKSYEIRKKLYEPEPESPQRVIDLCLSELKLAAWHISINAPEHDRTSLVWLNQIKDRLSNLNNRHLLGEVKFDVERILKAVDDDQKIINKRSED